MLAARRVTSRLCTMRTRALASSAAPKPDGKPGPSSADGNKTAYDADGKPLPVIPDATRLFKLSNPELMLDPKKGASWMVVGSVVAFFGVYLTWTAYREGLLFDGGQKMAEDHAAEVTYEAEVQKVLPDGRLLLRDGSIVRRSAAAGQAKG